LLRDILFLSPIKFFFLRYFTSQQV